MEAESKGCCGLFGLDFYTLAVCEIRRPWPTFLFFSGHRRLILFLLSFSYPISSLRKWLAGYV